MDGWALTLLSPQHVGYAATCQTIGTSSGFFTSFTVFLALQASRLLWVLPSTNSTPACAAHCALCTGLVRYSGAHHRACNGVHTLRMAAGAGAGAQDAKVVNTHIRSRPWAQSLFGMAPHSDVGLVTLGGYLRCAVCTRPVGAHCTAAPPSLPSLFAG